MKQNCPKGMCYINICYECSKDLQLNFYTKKYLDSNIDTGHGADGPSSIFLGKIKSDQEVGSHFFPLKSDLLYEMVSPDIVKIPVELFYYSKTNEGEIIKF